MNSSCARLSSVLLAIAALGRIACVVAEDVGPPVEVGEVQQPESGVPAGASDSASLTADEQQFLQQVAELNVTGIAMAKVAGKHANSLAVDTLSQQLRLDHALSLAALREIVRAKKVPVVEKPNPAQQDSIATLELLFGPPFDEEYRRAVMDHQELAIRTYYAGTKVARDPDIRAFAGRNFEELKLQRSGMRGKPVVVEGERVFRLPPPAPCIAFRIPASDGSWEGRFIVQFLPALKLAVRFEAACFASGIATGPDAAMMLGLAAQAPRLQHFASVDPYALPTVAEGPDTDEEDAAMDETGRKRSKSSTASRGGRKKAKGSAPPVPAIVAEAPKPWTFFLFGRRSSSGQTGKTKGNLASGQSSAAARPSTSRPFRLFGN